VIDRWLLRAVAVLGLVVGVYLAAREVADWNIDGNRLVSNHYCSEGNNANAGWRCNV